MDKLNIGAGPQGAQAPKELTAARALVRQLVVNGVDHVFTVPGESFLPVLDALADTDIQVTVCRQEGGAAMMADAYGKATGKPGICFVTRGPGATNASVGINVARQDSTPLIMFVGQIEREIRDREAFQEMDYRAVFGPMSKWATEIDVASRVPEYVSRAFHTATGGRPGPVVVALPKDMLKETISGPAASAWRPVEAAPAADDIAEIRDLLASAKRPFLLIGGSCWTDNAYADIRELRRALRPAGRHQLPSSAAVRSAASQLRRRPWPQRQSQAGSPRARLRSLDRRSADGSARSRARPMPCSTFPTRAPKLVHVHPGAEELGRVYAPHLAINACAQSHGDGARRPPRSRDHAVAGETRASAMTSTSPGARRRRRSRATSISATIMIHLRETLPRDAIICNGAGNYASWIHRFYRFRQPATHFAPTSGTMGYGVPAAVAMKRLFREPHGDFAQWRRRLPDERAGIRDCRAIRPADRLRRLRQCQLRHDPHAPGAGLSRPRLRHRRCAIPISRSTRAPSAASATRWRGAEDFPAALAEAMASGMPAIVHVKMSTDAILPGTSLTSIRNKALASR